ncbi:GFA family protein [Phenylobacterium sp.]|uniref:GFA family protein n=1 Tax=Phenylobacterium sp. TaxID=1871053 RepID=UPI001815C7A8|nr:GFA family protein [Phenylobacterium sp.]MBA4795130.1 GFA family protein [Phenylobacterium sp.]MBC7166949.1 GFA family protein [Phenylobacterium sp.]
MSETTTIRHTGGCLCGGYRYAVTGALAGVQFCHCSQCRKAQGAAFAANMPVALADFEILAGEELLQVFESSPGKERVFCGRCGSPAFSRTSARPGFVRIRAGTLDAPAKPPLGFHFYVDSKADWWAFDADIPRYGERAPA